MMNNEYILRKDDDINYTYILSIEEREQGEYKLQGYAEDKNSGKKSVYGEIVLDRQAISEIAKLDRVLEHPTEIESIAKDRGADGTTYSISFSDGTQKVLKEVRNGSSRASLEDELKQLKTYLMN